MMTKNIFFKITCGVCCLFLSPLAMSTQHYTCPPSPPITQTATVAAPWEVASDMTQKEYFLERIGMFSSNTLNFQMAGELVPDNEDEDVPVTATQDKSIWNFSKEEYVWLGCFYRNTKLVALRALPPVTRCEVTFATIPTGFQISGEWVLATHKITCW